MKMIKAATVNDYIAAFPKKVQQSLLQIRKIIKTEAPDAEESVSYGMPAYKYLGKPLVYFAGFENHIGFYATPTGHKTFQKDLAGYKTGKGSVQFPLDQPMPLPLITKIVKFRVAENQAQQKVKPVKKAVKKSPQSSEVEQLQEWLSQLDSTFRIAINEVRKIIKAANPKLSERIKWNAPSYYYHDDILTFGPVRTGKLFLVIHHPAVEKIKSAILEGSYKNRRLVHFTNKDEVKKKSKELTRVINEIIKAIDKEKQ